MSLVQTEGVMNMLEVVSFLNHVGGEKEGEDEIIGDEIGKGEGVGNEIVEKKRGNGEKECKEVENNWVFVDAEEEAELRHQALKGGVRFAIGSSNLGNTGGASLPS
nr:hypothetical protein Iba_chr09aCG14350 [Ipomoea batatas]